MASTRGGGGSRCLEADGCRLSLRSAPGVRYPYAVERGAAYMTKIIIVLKLNMCVTTTALLAEKVECRAPTMRCRRCLLRGPYARLPRSISIFTRHAAFGLCRVFTFDTPRPSPSL